MAYSKSRKGKPFAYKKKQRKNNYAFLFFLFFILTAAITVYFLELPQKSKEFSNDLESFNHQLLQYLKEKKIAYDYFRDKEKKYHFRIDVMANQSNGILKSIKKITDKYNGMIEIAEIQEIKKKVIILYNISFSNRLSHLYLMVESENPEIPKEKIESPPEKKPTPEEKIEKTEVKKTPRIAIIIDDIGNKDLVSLELKNLKIPITGSIIPNSAFALEESRRLYQYGLEQMIHLPMQAKNQDNDFNNEQFISLHSSDLQIQNLIKNAKKLLPYAQGVNNHMGSLITSSREMITRVLTIIKKEKLFFIDSKTTPSTLAYYVARELNIPTLIRDVFLDDLEYKKDNYSLSVKLIHKLVETARIRGKAIAIGHPLESTLQALKDSIHYIQSNGIQIVFVSQLLEKTD